MVVIKVLPLPRPSPALGELQPILHAELGGAPRHVISLLPRPRSSRHNAIVPCCFPTRPPLALLLQM